MDIDLKMRNHVGLCFIFCFVAIVTTSIPDIVMASDGISATLCLVVDKLQGPIGKAVATIGVVALGIGLFLGKLSWSLALATALGIGFIFGSSTIVDWLSNSTSDNC